MTFSTVSNRILLAIAVSALASIPVGAAPRRKVTSAAPARAVPNTAIIPLPLTPIVPSAQRLCAARTPTGLGYTMLRAAPGTRPGGGDVVLVNYIGYLAATGAVFDQGMRAQLPLDGVIPGFSQGLHLPARTGVVRLCIPAALGYGAQASGPIPANSDLVFQVELLDYKTAAEIAALSKAQATDPAAPAEPAPKP